MSNYGPLDKIKLISDTVKNILNNYLLDARKEEKIKKLASKFEKLPTNVEDFAMNDKSSLILPIEEPREYQLSQQFGDTVEATYFLETHDISVGSFDSSYFSLGVHLIVPVSIVTIGAWYMNYSERTYGELFDVDGEADIVDNIDLQIRIKMRERNVINSLIYKLGGRHKIILFDESFNCSYTLSWSHDKREQMINNLVGNIKLCIENGVIPVALFHTRSRDLFRGMTVLLNEGFEESIGFTDSFFFQRYLKNKFSRSPLFKVYSKPLKNKKINLACFYIKVDSNNVIRAEFPIEFIDDIEIIYQSIIAQIILGRGFPLAMQRAHELAVIKREYRDLIETLIANYLGKPGIELLLSKKELSKRRPLS